MANYQESSLTGTQYKRCCEMQIINPLGATPVVHFKEQQVLLLDDKIITERTGGIEVLYDAAKTVPLLDPATGQATGASTTYADIYAALYSAYIAAATERDAQ